MSKRSPASIESPGPPHVACTRCACPAVRIHGTGGRLRGPPAPAVPVLVLVDSRPSPGSGPSVEPEADTLCGLTATAAPSGAAGAAGHRWLPPLPPAAAAADEAGCCWWWDAGWWGACPCSAASTAACDRALQVAQVHLPHVAHVTRTTHAAAAASFAPPPPPAATAAPCPAVPCTELERWRPPRPAGPRARAWAWGCCWGGSSALTRAGSSPAGPAPGLPSHRPGPDPGLALPLLAFPSRAGLGWLLCCWCAVPAAVPSGPTLAGRGARRCWPPPPRPGDGEVPPLPAWRAADDDATPAEAERARGAPASSATWRAAMEGRGAAVTSRVVGVGRKGGTAGVGAPRAHPAPRQTSGR